MEQKVLYQYGHLFKANAYNSEGIGTGVLKNLDQLDVVHKLAMAEIQKIQSNRNLTSQGKVAAFRALAEKTDESLAELDRRLTGYSNQVQQLEEAVKPKRHPRDDIAYQLELREIRDQIRLLDPLDQDAFILAALEAGNLQIMEAVRYAPIPFKFASSEMIEKIQARQQAIQHPEETARLADLRLASTETSSAISSVKAVLWATGLSPAQAGRVRSCGSVIRPPGGLGTVPVLASGTIKQLKRPFLSLCAFRYWGWNNAVTLYLGLGLGS